MGTTFCVPRPRGQRLATYFGIPVGTLAVYEQRAVQNSTNYIPSVPLLLQDVAFYWDSQRSVNGVDGDVSALSPDTLWIARAEKVINDFTRKSHLLSARQKTQWGRRANRIFDKPFATLKGKVALRATHYIAVLTLFLRKLPEPLLPVVFVQQMVTILASDDMTEAAKAQALQKASRDAFMTAYPAEYATFQYVKQLVQRHRGELIAAEVEALAQHMARESDERVAKFLVQQLRPLVNTVITSPQSDKKEAPCAAPRVPTSSPPMPSQPEQEREKEEEKGGGKDKNGNQGDGTEAEMDTSRRENDSTKTSSARTGETTAERSRSEATSTTEASVETETPNDAVGETAQTHMRRVEPSAASTANAADAKEKGSKENVKMEDEQVERGVKEKDKNEVGAREVERKEANHKGRRRATIDSESYSFTSEVVEMAAESASHPRRTSVAEALPAVAVATHVKEENVENESKEEVEDEFPHVFPTPDAAAMAAAITVNHPSRHFAAVALAAPPITVTSTLSKTEKEEGEEEVRLKEEREHRSEGIQCSLLKEAPSVTAVAGRAPFISSPLLTLRSEEVETAHVQTVPPLTASDAAPPVLRSMVEQHPCYAALLGAKQLFLGFDKLPPRQLDPVLMSPSIKIPQTGNHKVIHRSVCEEGRTEEEEMEKQLHKEESQGVMSAQEEARVEGLLRAQSEQLRHDFIEPLLFQVSHLRSQCEALTSSVQAREDAVASTAPALPVPVASPSLSNEAEREVAALREALQQLTTAHIETSSNVAAVQENIAQWRGDAGTARQTMLELLERCAAIEQAHLRERRERDYATVRLQEVVLAMERGEKENLDLKIELSTLQRQAARMREALQRPM